MRITLIYINIITFVNIIVFFAKTRIELLYFLWKDVFIMFGKIIDMNNTDAFINFSDGTTIDISIGRLPKNSQTGDTVDLNIESPTNMANNKMLDFF